MKKCSDAVGAYLLMLCDDPIEENERIIHGTLLKTAVAYSLPENCDLK